MTSPKTRRYLYRSAYTGRFVTRAHAEKHPERTVRERVDVIPRGAPVFVARPVRTRRGKKK